MTLHEIENELSKLLPVWFKEREKFNKEDNNFWSQNKVANTLKSELKNWGHWKRRSDGRTGNKAAIEKARAQKELIKKEKEACQSKNKELDW